MLVKTRSKIVVTQYKKLGSFPIEFSERAVSIYVDARAIHVAGNSIIELPSQYNLSRLRTIHPKTSKRVRSERIRTNIEKP